MKYDVISIGNAVIDVFLSFDPSNKAVSLKKDEKLLCFPYGQKVLVNSSAFLMGGNACNVSVGLTRAGFSTALVAELASDEFSEKIMHGLTHEGVKTELLKRSNGQSSFSIGFNVEGERTLFVEHHDRLHNFDFSSVQTKAIYLTSLGHTWQHVYKKVGEYLQHAPDTLLAFNPGSVQFLDGVETFRYLFPLTSILFVNKEEAEKIVGKKSKVSELLLSLSQLGPHIISLTDGDRGAYAITRNGEVFQQEIIPCPVIERTGAGDAYATGFLASYLTKHSIKDAMYWGVHNSSSVISHIGSQPGLLTRAELEAK